MRTSFTINQDGTFTIKYQEFLTGDRITRHFWAPSDGGYIRELLPNLRQTCANLGVSGSTLQCDSRKHCYQVLRNAYTAMRKAEKKITLSNGATL
jgi:predicted ATP-grasp superfamily ATP-dependent carboligase